MKLNLQGQFEFKSNSDFLNHIVSLGGTRWLHSIDFNPVSLSYGIGDREYWSWKTKDFANATWQGGISGFLDSRNFLSLEDKHILQVVHATICGARKIQRKDGSFEEAYPLESSVCVTALVLFNILYSYYVYPQYFASDSYNILEDIVKESYCFLSRNAETHGVISNHTATIFYAKRMARRFLSLKDTNFELTNFLNLQNCIEGWFPEYGNPDPGYQTLLNHYVMAGAYALGELNIFKSLIDKSNNFVSLFCFPDGSYSGEIGGRGTSIVYPSGFLLVNKDNLIGSCASTWFTNSHLPLLDCVTPLNIDGPNFVPVFNSWAFYTKIVNENTDTLKSNKKKFSEAEEYLKDGQIYVKKTPISYVSISFFNGALRRGIYENNNWKDESISAFTRNGMTTQGAPVSNISFTPDTVSWNYNATKLKQILPDALKLTVLRLLSFFVFRLPTFQRALKIVMARLILKPAQIHPTSLQIRINLNDPKFAIELLSGTGEGWKIQNFGFHQHMASANTFSRRSIG